jgi:hypothetical protein
MNLHVPLSCINSNNNNKFDNNIGYWFAIEIIGKSIDNDQDLTYISTPVFISPTSIEHNKDPRILIKSGCLNNGLCKFIPGINIDNNNNTTDNNNDNNNIDINNIDNNIDNKITLILPLHLDDTTRSIILIESLKFITSSAIQEFILVVPDSQFVIIDSLLRNLLAELVFPSIIVCESILFLNVLPNDDIFSYALQMAIKLLVAKYISTTYFLTLDADLILLRPLYVSQLLIDSSTSNNNNSIHTKRAIFEFESRLKYHPDWWKGSEVILGLDDNLISGSNGGGLSQGFGVTPAVLSTFGSLLTLNRIRISYRLKHMLGNQNDDKDNNININGDDAININNNVVLNDAEIELLWLEGFGKDGQKWSEYTLYRLTLDYYQVQYLIYLFYLFYFIISLL